MERFLIVEDSDIGREVLAFALADRFTCDLAVNGAEAIEYLKRNRYACVLLDLIMPDIDGFGVLEFMRERAGQDPEVKMPTVIVLTSSSEEGIRERCLAAGAADFLNKPFKLREINAALARAGIAG